MNGLIVCLALAGQPAYTLEALVERADADNLELKAAKEKIIQAEIQIDKAWSALMPVVSVAGAYTRNSDEAKLAFPDFSAPFGIAPDPKGTPTSYLLPTGLIEATIQPFNQWGGMAKVSVPVLVMPAYSGIRAAERGAEATGEGIEHARSELLFGLSQAFYGAVAAQKLVELAGEQLQAAKRQESLATVRVEAGQAPKISALRAGVDRARAEQDVRRANNAVEQAKLAIAQLCGLEGPFSVVPPKAPPAVGLPLDQMLPKALEDRHDLRSAKLALEAHEEGLDAALWSFAPILAASAEYRLSNVGGFTGESSTWLIQVAAQWTLYDAARYADLDAARSRVREAAFNRDATIRKIEQEVKSARLDLENAEANLAKAREQEKLAVENLALVEVHAQNGLATYLDASDAQTARFGAGVAVVAEEVNVQVAALKVLKAVGALFEHKG